MEDLNKNQIILLVLLVSFVTSIATGIMTVSLLQQAPVEVTRNINNVVEKTIEKVVPTSILPSSGSKETTTVVVKEDDMVVQSINKNLKSIVRINERDSITDVKSFYGVGVVISQDGMIISGRKDINPTSIYTVEMSDGKNFTLAPIGIDKNTNFILFKVNQTEKAKYDFNPASLSSTDPQLGQTVISLGGDSSNAVSVGRVIYLETKENQSGGKYIVSVETDVSSKDLVLGSPIFDLSGNVIGMKYTESSIKVFSPVSVLKSEINYLNTK